MYKDRMSVYINETVAGAETFNNPAEKLKYMKNETKEDENKAEERLVQGWNERVFQTLRSFSFCIGE